MLLLCLSLLLVVHIPERRSMSNGSFLNEELKRIIELVNELIKAEFKEQESIYNQTKNISDYYRNQITEFNLVQFKADPVLVEELIKIKELKFMLIEKVNDERRVRLQEEYQDLMAVIGKLELGIKLLMEDLERVENRRNSSYEKNCLRLEYGTELLPVNPSFDLNQTSVEEGAEFTELLKKIRTAESNLAYQKGRTSDLRLKQKLKEGFWRRQFDEMQQMLQHVGGDLQTAKAVVDDLNYQLSSTKEETESFINKIEKGRVAIETDKATVKQLADNIKAYGKALRCYSRLEDEVTSFY